MFGARSAAATSARDRSQSSSIGRTIFASQINLCDCSRVSEVGLARLRQLPRLKLIWLDGMSIEDAGRRITGESMAASGH